MPGYPDAVVLLRQLRPPHEPAPDLEGLERILATPPERPPRPRGARRLVLAAVALAVLAVALTPVLRSSPSVVARAAAALNDADTILHFRAQVGGPGGRPATYEVWQTAGGRQQRMLINDLELVEDWETKTSLSYSAERDELIRHTEPDIFDPEHRIRGIDAPSPLGGVNITEDLALAFERARRGEGSLRLVGPAEVDGTAVYELELAFAFEAIVLSPGVEDPRGLPTRQVPMTRTVYVDRETFLPVRVVERTEGRITEVTDYVLAERLPRTPANERLLKMSPHPGAKRVTEGRL